MKSDPPKDPRRPSAEIPVLTRSSSPPSSQGMRAFGTIAPRDIDATAFTRILDDLLQRVPGAYAAALVDAEGETVDYSGRGDPFDLKVAAAHLQLVLQGIDRFGALGTSRWLVVRGPKKSIAATVLPDGYALVLLLKPRAAFTISSRAISACAHALAVEAGFTQVERRDGGKARVWFPVSVEIDGRGRPVTINQQSTVEVLGVVMGLSVRERGFRVRTAGGNEVTLIREPKGRWYADEAVDR